jgi:exonuclease SbcC
MIPLRLSLRNFMCYREIIPALNFESIHTACISGDNGNGKSALIDAITWAIWGQTRASNDDELIYSGQSDVGVELEFAMGHQRYKVIRKHSKPKSLKGSGQTMLEFQGLTPDGYKVLSGDTISQTQNKILDTLHMDYKTFVNSAFIRQGKADEFTKNSPNERKQVLGNILQLSEYEDFEEQAKLQFKQQETLISQIEANLSSLKEELTHKEEYQAEFEQAQNDLSETETIVEKHQQLLNQLKEDKKSVDYKTAQLAELTANLQESEKNLVLWIEQVQHHQNLKNKYEELISQKVIIVANYNQLIELRRQNHDLEQRLKQDNTLNQAKHRLDILILKAGEELKRAHAISENRIYEMELIVQNLYATENELYQVGTQLKTLDEEEKLLIVKQDEIKVMRGKVNFLEAEKSRLNNEIQYIDEKIDMLTQKEGAGCPLCESELGVGGRKRIQDKYQSEKNTKQNQLHTNQNELAQVEYEVNIREKETLLMERRLKQTRQVAQSKSGSLDRAVSDAREARQKILLEREHLNQIEQILAKKDFAVKEQESLRQIEDNIKDVGYNPQHHEFVRNKLTSCETYEMQKHKLEEAETLVIQEKKSEAKAQIFVQEVRFKLEDFKKRRLSLLAELAVASRVAGDLMLAETEYMEIISKQKQIQERVGATKARLEGLAVLESKYREKENQLKEVTKCQAIYRDLAQAFGKKGIQAMLIEMTIPDIEAEANKLLSRMTDNRMHVKLEPRRETKKGVVLETLEINISDELGTRNYEMYSGGEAFRIDFAIRIALSKLLARRAGAPLPTLIIDEGFGTQDSTGIEKIKEAITSIQDDFEKILVITHIDNFKDAFPMRIDVVKTSEGSAVYLN